MTTMPGHTYRSTNHGVLQVIFHPKDVQEPRRGFVAESFTEMVIILQTQWEDDDTWVEIIRQPADTDVAMIPGLEHVDSKIDVGREVELSTRGYSTVSTQQDGNSALSVPSLLEEADNHLSKLNTPIEVKDTEPNLTYGSACECDACTYPLLLGEE